MASNLEAAKRVEATTFGDRLAEAIDRKRTQLVVGLDPQRDLLPVELAGDAHQGRITRRTRSLLLQRDRRCGRALRRGRQPQLAFFEALGADGMRARRCAPTRDRPAARHRRRQARRHRLHGPGVCGRLPRGLAASRRRADGQPVSRPRLPGAVDRGLPPPRGRRLLPRQDVQRRRRDPGSEALRRPAALAARGEAGRGVGRTWSASGGFRASAPSWARHIRVPSARHAASCRSRSCSSRVSAPRALPRETSHAPSRVGRPARSSLLRGRSSMPSGRRPRPTGAPAAAEAARLKSEIWVAAGW